GARATTRSTRCARRSTRSRAPSAASGDVRPVAGGAIVVAGVDRHPKVWPSHIEDRRVAPGATSARRTGRTLPDAALASKVPVRDGDVEALACLGGQPVVEDDDAVGRVG